MVAPQRDLIFDKLIEISDKLNAIQNLALIGLHSLRPNLPPSIIATSTQLNEENISAAEKWLLINFRKLFAFYCEKYQETNVLIAGEAIRKAEIVKHLAPLIVSTYSIPLGIAVAFLFAAINIGLDKWCEKYSRKSLTGEGTYAGNFPQRQVEGYFEIEWLPAITERIEDPGAYPLKGYKVIVKIPADITGQVKVPTPKDSDEIFFSFKGQSTHSFSFSDLRFNKRVDGRIEVVTQKKTVGPNILGFIPTGLVETSLPIRAQEITPSAIKTEPQSLGDSLLTVKSGLTSPVCLLDKDPFMIFLEARVREGKPVPSTAHTLMALKYIFGMALQRRKYAPLYQTAVSEINRHTIQVAHTADDSNVGRFTAIPVGEYYVAAVLETTNAEFLWNVKVVLPEPGEYFVELNLKNAIT